MLKLTLMVLGVPYVMMAGHSLKLMLFADD